MTTTRAPWLGDVLSDAGLRVATPVGQPVGRGRDMTTVYGVVGHDTVTGTNWTDLAAARLLRDGHANLSGPLSQLGVRRDGTVDWIADGRCNHNGYGTWGNDAVGIEVYVAGCGSPREPWHPAQRETVVTCSAAILGYLDHESRSSYWNPRVAGHKETDPGRKVDPCGVDMAAVRRDVAALMEGADVALTDEDVSKVVAALTPVVERAVAAHSGPSVWGYLPDGQQRDAWSRLSSGGLRFDELANAHPHDLPVVVEAIRGAVGGDVQQQ